jgi:YD repeat-containing protein
MHLTTGTTGDRIIANAITLGGTLELSSNAGFAPAAYASQRLISATSVSGRFGQLAGNLQESGHALAVTYDSTGVLVTAAIAGDTNLDRAVNFDDLLTLAQNYGLTTGQTWSTGDLNGSGSVDFDDLLGLAQTYGQSAIMTSALPAEFAADWALARSLTPEPTALFTLATAAAMPRRRRIA